MPHPNLRPFILGFNTLWPAALCYAHHYLLRSLSWEYHFTFMRFFIYAHFKNTTME